MKLPLANPLRYRRLAVRCEVLDRAPPVSLTRPEEVAAFCHELLDSPQEVFVWIGLDVRKHVVAVSELFRGTIDACTVHPREIFRSALVLAPTVGGIVVVHNHPSGVSEPSDEDVALFERLAEAGELLRIPLIDALVVAQDGWWSREVGGCVRARGSGHARDLDEQPFPDEPAVP